MLQELFQPNFTEMWFDFGGKNYRFGIDNSSIIIGLMHDGDGDKTKFETIRNYFKNSYFPTKKTISRKDVKDSFLAKI